MQGILLKRRDHFKSSWRPRFFILDQRNLTYFILKNEYEHYSNLRQQDHVLSDESESFSHLVGNLLGPFEELNSSQLLNTPSPSPKDHSCASSNADNSSSFEQQPRGIFRLEGADVAVENELSQDQPNLFAFSIALKSDNQIKQPPIIYLAASTLEDRDKWITAIRMYTKQKRESNPNQSISKESTDSSKCTMKMDEPLYSTFRSFLIFDKDAPDRNTLFYNLICLTPLIVWTAMRHYSIKGKELIFIPFMILTFRFLIMRKLGKPLPNVTNYRGPVCFNFMVDLTNVLRYIQKIDDHEAVDHLITKKSLEKSRVSVTSIVIKAVACALESIQSLNSKHVYYPILAIDDYYFQKDHLSVSFLSALSTGDENRDSIPVDHLDRLSIPDVAKRVDSLRSMESNSRNSPIAEYLSASRINKQTEAALVILSPDSGHSKLDMTACSASVNVTVVIGGVRVVRKENKKVYFLSIGVTVNCPKCSVGMSRRFVELLQTFIHEPERL